MRHLSVLSLLLVSCNTISRCVQRSEEVNTHDVFVKSWELAYYFGIWYLIEVLRNTMMVNSKITSTVVCIKNAVRKFSILFTSHMRNACENIDIIVGWFHSIIQDQECIPNGGNEGFPLNIQRNLYLNGKSRGFRSWNWNQLHN